MAKSTQPNPQVLAERVHSLLDRLAIINTLHEVLRVGAMSFVASSDLPQKPVASALSKVEPPIRASISLPQQARKEFAK